ncbi:hypothetical protein BUALT_Bualt03G0188200 [Buddleja alternifolia]|uniref:Uncharacterized protein n=1 Tax=Buddleja alternifolia TaxID=168488 RepID=A0AAV6XUY5_9LAMI|nr:hypothetical protein BUALT_Bualt03G0188200 [Buddleja alternifolia]
MHKGKMVRKNGQLPNSVNSRVKAEFPGKMDDASSFPVDKVKLVWFGLVFFFWGWGGGATCYMEDTVKYVENQVQKVGASVKKFCSEVMQDLHSTSCVDPVKVAAGELCINPYAHNDMNKKPKSIILDSLGEPKKKEAEDKVVSVLTVEKSSLNDLNNFNSLSPLSPRVLVQKTPSVLCSAKSKNLGIHRRAIGIKRISQNNRPPKISSPMTSLKEDGRSKLTSDTRSSCAVASDEIVTPSSGSVVRVDPGEPANENKHTNALIESSASNKIFSAESARQKKDDSDCTSSCTENIGASVKDISASQLGSSFRTNNACEVESVGKEVVMMSNEGKFTEDGSSSQLTSNISSNDCGIESAGDNVIVSYEDSFDMEVIENAEVVEPRVQKFEPVEKSKLEETCVLVEGDELQFISQGTEKHKSYKKKIREAISSKLRSTKKQDERITHYKDLGGNNNAGVAIPRLMTGSDKTKLTAHDSSESDWELL